MFKRLMAAMGLVTAASGGLLYAATRAEEPAPVTTTTQQTAETIICPLTGEEIEPCCCPLKKGE